MIVALIFYLLGSVALLLIEHRLEQWTGQDPTLRWLNRHVYTPLARAIVVLLFIVLAYPALFGLHGVPPLLQILRDSRVDLVITTAFFASLVIPLLPVVDRLPGTVIAVQGILAVAMIGGWLGEHLGHSVAAWPGWAVTLQVLTVLASGGILAGVLTTLSPARFRERYAASVREAARMAAEAPAILLYAHALGRQLPQVYGS